MFYVIFFKFYKFYVNFFSVNGNVYGMEFNFRFFESSNDIVILLVIKI